MRTLSVALPDHYRLPPAARSCIAVRYSDPESETCCDCWASLEAGLNLGKLCAASIWHVFPETCSTIMKSLRTTCLLDDYILKQGHTSHSINPVKSNMLPRERPLPFSHPCTVVIPIHTCAAQVAYPLHLLGDRLEVLSHQPHDLQNGERMEISLCLINASCFQSPQIVEETAQRHLLECCITAVSTSGKRRFGC